MQKNIPSSSQTLHFSFLSFLILELFFILQKDCPVDELVKRLRAAKRKFMDPVFPPVETSLVSNLFS